MRVITWNVNRRAGRLAEQAFALAVAALALALAPSAAPAAERKTCKGSISFSGTKTRIVVLRGVSCRKAKRVARAYDKGSPPGSWRCALARAPFDRIDGRIVGFSCGRGGSGELRKRPHAFAGTVRG